MSCATANCVGGLISHRPIVSERLPKGKVADLLPRAILTIPRKSFVFQLTPKRGLHKGSLFERIIQLPFTLFQTHFIHLSDRALTPLITKTLAINKFKNNANNLVISAIIPTFATHLWVPIAKAVARAKGTNR